MTRTASRPRTARGLRGAGAALASVTAALLLAACGSSTSNSSSAKASTAVSGNGVAAKSPAQIVAAAQAALRATNGFVAAGTLSQGGQAVQLRIVDRGTSMLQLQINASGKSAEVLVFPHDGYVRANLAFWSAQAVPKATSLANRWIALPASASCRTRAGCSAR